MPRRRVHVVLVLPKALLVVSEALGARFVVTVAGVKADLTFPVPRGPESNWLAAPPGRANATHVRIASEREEIDWGHHYSSFAIRAGRRVNVVWGVRALAASFLLDPASHPLKTAEVQAFCGAFRAWYATVCEWICAKHGLPLRDGSGHHESLLYGLGKKRTWASSGEIGVPMMADVQGALRTELRSAFDRAARGQPLPLQHRLLLDARTYLHEGANRRAVIDAGTATEIALTEFLAIRLRSNGVAPKDLDVVILQANGLVGLAALTAASGHELPVSLGAVKGELAGVRNAAAHRGTGPTHEGARKAITLAHQIVESVTPLTFP
jgi:hypothetical protein